EVRARDRLVFVYVHRERLAADGDRHLPRRLLERHRGRLLRANAPAKTYKCDYRCDGQHSLRNQGPPARLGRSAKELTACHRPQILLAAVPTPWAAGGVFPASAVEPAILLIEADASSITRMIALLSRSPKPSASARSSSSICNCDNGSVCPPRAASSRI